MMEEQNLSGNLRFLISTRGRDGRYGPQSRDMSLSELISVFKPKQASLPSSNTIIFPDLSALARKMDAQIREHFNRFREEELAQNYDVLFNTWTQAGSIANASKRSSRWLKVMDLSMEYILLAQKRMPEPARFSPMQEDCVNEVATKGKMYCEALLFHIVARSTYDHGSLANDVTLRGYCQWLKDWLKGYIDPYDYERLLLGAAVKKPEYLEILQLLAGQNEPLDARALLVDSLSNPTHVNNSYYSPGPDFAVEMTCKLNFWTFSHASWEMINVLRDLHYRVTRIEKFLEILEDTGENVDFTRTYETNAVMEGFISHVEAKHAAMIEEPPETT
ncbi:hypothetical protein P4908_09680 [Pantoea ananatis]|uniref:hypothetical protein n=1 Tax=Pantoea ananas TaxID=553 RepID=UPI0023FA43B9|nr:hypothetical protein [Pantoea ananatis]MDF7790505.1 hypothetical protein [Pantoea ananatis]